MMKFIIGILLRSALTLLVILGLLTLVFCFGAGR